MKVTQITVPGGGVLHDVLTRDGEQFRLLVEPTGERRIFIDDPEDRDRLLVELVLDQGEADAIADILHSSPIRDRVASLERRLDEHLEVRDRGGRPLGDRLPGTST